LLRTLYIKMKIFPFPSTSTEIICMYVCMCMYIFTHTQYSFRTKIRYTNISDNDVTRREFNYISQRCNVIKFLM
jgi:hypothetical protein